MRNGRRDGKYVYNVRITLKSSKKMNKKRRREGKKSERSVEIKANGGREVMGGCGRLREHRKRNRTNRRQRRVRR